MSLLNKQQLDQLASAVSKVEEKTDAELVTVLAHASDSYHYIPTLYAALIALLTPGVLSFSPLWLGWFELIIVQALVFSVLALVFRIPALRYRLVPAKVKKSRAEMMARRMFLEQGLHHTKGETGILIFVSEAEHYVEILVDRGISEKIDNKVWQNIVNDFTAEVKAGAVLKGFETCIASVAEVVSDVVPATEEKNELPDRLVVL
ncbi:putative membrane protein [Thalassolituus maritimus]|uniref:Putative membrane protein n=1 Tax=Thalassolituus maritimus TaxID=484498 RepID=A0A1N7MWI8_9GAMM|nr:TPM domain-containing protein [Thalassolituus maritimus]SIS90301.1 putative membrane protein [Thalassolituus maritimus]